jgi:hypothetical protein
MSLRSVINRIINHALTAPEEHYIERVEVGRPNWRLSRLHADLLRDPSTVGQGYTWLELSTGAGLELARVVLTEAVRGPARRQLTVRGDDDDGRAFIEVPIRDPASERTTLSAIRVELELCDADEVLLALARHMLDTGRLEVKPIVEYGPNPMIVGWSAKFRATPEVQGALHVQWSERGLWMRIDKYASC